MIELHRSRDTYAVHSHIETLPIARVIILDMLCVRLDADLLVPSHCV